LVLAILSPLFAKLIQLAVSRKREFLADASGVLLTRFPDALISALKKISHNPAVAKSNKATAHLYISNPLKGKKISRFLSTHPPVEERIAALKAMH
jgi:heat shock protein HtpX